MGGQRQDGRLPPWEPFHRASGTAVSLSAKLQQFHSNAFALHFTFFIIFLMCVTSSSDLNLAEKITQRSDAPIH